MMDNKFEEAIPHFEKSVQYFENRPQLDKYRLLAFLSISKMTYKEMGLYNLARCYTQLNEAEKATSLYEKIVLEYPNNQNAISAIQMINLKEAEIK